MAKKSHADDGIMSLPACAKYLHLSQKTVLKLAAESKLPGVLANNRWRFQRAEVDRWLQQQLSGEDRDFEDIPDGTRVPLGDIMPDDAVIGDLHADDALGVIEELAAHAYSNNWLADKPWFIGAVVERESLASTAMDGGVAFLHTRARDTSKIARPFVIAGRSYDGIDFGSPDGKPTYLFFLLGLKYDKLHLPILGRLARAMRDPKTIARLRALPSPQKMRALLLEEDAAVLSQAKTFPVRYEAAKPKLDRQMRLRTIMRLNAQRKHQAKKAAEAKRKAAAKSAAAANRKTSRKAKATSADAAAKKSTAAGKTSGKATAASKRGAAIKPAASKKLTSAKSASTTRSTGKAASAAKTAAKSGATKTATSKSGKKSVASGKSASGKSTTAKKPTTSRRTGGKKTTAASVRSTGKKSSARKPAAKKSTAKKSAAKKSTAKKSAAKKSTAKKSAAKKSAERKN